MNIENPWMLAWMMSSYALQQGCFLPFFQPSIPSNPLQTQENNQTQSVASGPTSQKMNEFPTLSPQQKGKRRPKKVKQDQSDYSLPEEIPYKQIEQKSGRNCASNILRTFAKFLKFPNFRQAFSKIQDRLGLKMAYKQFLSWLSGIGLSSHKYIRTKRIFKGAKAKPRNGRILCIMFSMFEKQYGRQMVLTSKKTENKNVLPTLLEMRKIRENLEELIQEQFSRNICG